MIKFEPLKATRFKLEKIPFLRKFIGNGVHKSLYEVGREHVQHARDLMMERKSGRIYKIGGFEHQASAPGEPAANLSGELSRHIDYNVESVNRLRIGHKRQKGIKPYGLYIEEGSEHMAARSVLKRTVIDKQKDARNSIVRYVNRSIIKEFS